MRNKLLIAGLLLITAVTFGQKKEIKKADKAIKSGDVTEAMNLLSQAEQLIDNADKSTKVTFYITRAKAYIGKLSPTFEDFSKAGDDLQKALQLGSDVEKNTDYEETVYALKQKVETSAIKDFNSEKYIDASNKYMLMYGTSKKDTVFLANAAISSKNGHDYEKAIEIYEELISLGYTDIRMLYTATNKETGKVDEFGSKAERDAMLLAGTHTLPGEEKSASKQDDFLNHLTILYAETGRTDRALELIGELRQKNPDDNRLLRAEADFNLKMGKMERYQELISELIDSDPTNPELYFNLGVTSYKAGKIEKAKEYYNKAIELDPDYVGAQINMASMILDQQQPIVEVMNSLGTSNADYKKYDELKDKLLELQRSSIPYLEASVRLRPDDIDFKRTLMNIYMQVGEDAKSDALKAKIKEIEEGN